MNPHVESVRAKVRRADDHLHRLEQEFVHYATEPPGMMTGWFELTEHDGRTGLTPHIVMRALPPEMGVTIGDAVHCLRSALDHIAWKVVPTPDHNTSFPIDDKPKAINRFGKASHPSTSGKPSDEVRQAFARFQPWWPAGETDLDHPMRLLRELSNNDKHRELSTPMNEYGVTDNEGLLEMTPGTRLHPRVQLVDAQEGRVDFGLRVRGEHGEVTGRQYSWRLRGIAKPIGAEPIEYLPLPTLRSLVELLTDEIIPTFKPLILR